MRSACQSDLTRLSCGSGPSLDAAILRDEASLLPCREKRRQPVCTVPPRISGVLEEASCNSTRHSKEKNVPAVGKLSRAIRPLKIISGITVPVSKRAKGLCNAPTHSPPASALCLRAPAPQRSNNAKKLQRGCWRELIDEHLTAAAPAENASAASRRGGYTRLAPPLERVGRDYSLLFLYDTVAFLGVLGYSLLSSIWGQTVLPNKKDPFSPACEVPVWLVDAPPP